MAQDRRRRRPQTEIYNNDATVIIETPTEETLEPVAQRRSVPARDIIIPVADVIDTLASYVSKPKWFERELADRPGTCLICKKATMCKIRKICADCMNKYSGEIYGLAEEAAENGQASVTLNVEV